MKWKRKAKPSKKGRAAAECLLDVEAIPAPTIVWHPSISLEKLISEFAEYQDSILVS